MPNKLLITFGCSWTYGVGVGYRPGMSLRNNNFWDKALADSLSFRGIISKKLDFTNKNFSLGGSSNQKQFRLAKEYFGSNEFDRDRKQYDSIVVLWGITSIYRNELYTNLTDETINFLYSYPDSLHNKSRDQYLKYFFNDHNEIRNLARDILFWNKFFSHNGITNYWFDTFNHHDYPIPSLALADMEDSYVDCAGPEWPQWKDLITQNIDQVDPKIQKEIYDTERFGWARIIKDFPGFNNFIDFANSPRDIASYLARYNGLDSVRKEIHMSNWEADTDCMKFLAEKDIVNPLSFHPTQLGHQQLADYFIEKISVK